MTIATTPVRTGNPGIVPPWLQGGGRPVTPIVPSPAPVAASPPSAAQAGRDALQFIPLGDGRVVVVDDGLGPSGAPERFSVAPAQRPARQDDASVARNQAQVEATVDEVRGFFTKLGVRDDEGNDRTTVSFNPSYHNASYSPEAIPELGVAADSITVGIDPRSGASFGAAKDVVAHEWSHRVIDHLTHGKLEMSPLSEDVAVHESLADTFAAAFDADDWIIGEDLAEPIRVVNDPEQLGHPDHVSDMTRILAPGSKFMHELPTRDGGVLRDRAGNVVRVPDWHVVAGIPNKAASLIGDSLGRDTMAKIYLKAVRENLRPGQEIEGLASAVMQSATDLFGAGSKELQVTRDAWDAVGVLDLVTKRAQSAPAR